MQAYAAALATDVDEQARRRFVDVRKVILVSVKRFVTSAAKSFRSQATSNVFRIDMWEPISNPNIVIAKGILARGKACFYVVFHCEEMLQWIL